MVYAFSSPDLCSLPAGAKSPKRVTKRKKEIHEKRERDKKGDKGIRRNFDPGGSSYI